MDKTLIEINQAYKKMFSEGDTSGSQGFMNAPGAPEGAMSSSPEVNKIFRPTSPDDPKFSIYNIFSKKKKKFKTESEATAFLETNPDWSFKENIKETIDNYISVLNKKSAMNEAINNKDLLIRWSKLQEDFEILRHETGKWLSSTSD